MTFRVLDLGACDAGIPMWLHEQQPGLHIDGLDLDRRQIQMAQERARKRGVAGEFKHGNALDAAEHFEAGSYDAVVAYELLEHVEDMGEFLQVCERMLKPGGTVFISTPNGTFGAGGNPHHLRALRMVDLCDVLRRRGRLVNALAGEDGVAVCSYTPAERKGEVAIYCGPGWEQWSPTDILTRGLGGSETAAVRLAEALDELGYLVTVYGEVEDCAYRSVLFRHWQRFDPMEKRQAVICSRMPEVVDRPVRAPYRALWLHDVDCGDRLTEARARQFNDVYVLSGWHEGHVRGRYPFLEAGPARVTRIRNGIEPRLFQPKPWADRARRVLYTSSPDRGLDVLLELWPRVRERVPDATLQCTYVAVYDRVAEQDPRVAEHREKIRALCDQAGVERLEPQSQPALARLMCDSRVWCHPSYVTLAGEPFHETSCIGATEAQAAGCHVVASDWGALRETVRYGRLVNGGALSEEWKRAFVDHIVEGLTDPDVGEAAAQLAPDAVADMDWMGVGRAVAGMIEGGQSPQGR